jgi:AcrR family transcriptional regulator
MVCGDTASSTAPAATTLTAERILEATEAVLRRYGAAKANVVDVARALGVSHASVYRHFATKAALRGAVTKRWLDRTTADLAVIVDEDRDPESRLCDWLAALFVARRHRSGEDPELHATYKALAAELGEAGTAHLDDLTAQLAEIIRCGAAAGTFTTVTDPMTTARAVLQATCRFHDSRCSSDWEQPDIEAQFATVMELVVRGLRA